MQTERLGIISFFGIFIPGTLLSFILCLGIFCVFEAFGVPNSLQKILGLVEKNTTLFATAFFITSYLLGMVVRLYSPEKIDEKATKFANSWVGKYYVREENRLPEKFPYSDSVESHLNNRGLKRVVDFMNNQNKNYSTSTFLNYCKLFILSKNPALGRQVLEAEALVRFLSGTAWILIYFGTLIPLAGFVIFTYKSFVDKEVFLIYSISFIALLIFNRVILSMILGRYRVMRKREVGIVWKSYHLLKMEEEHKK